MGFTYIKAKVFDPADLAKAETVELLVHSGALFTSIPRTLLQALGLKPVARQRLKAYGGNVVNRDIGAVGVEYGERRAVVPVVFGEPEDTSLLGATGLETLGYQLDPVTKELKPIEFLMM